MNNPTLILRQLKLALNIIFGQVGLTVATFATVTVFAAVVLSGTAVGYDMPDDAASLLSDVPTDITEYISYDEEQDSYIYSPPMPGDDSISIGANGMDYAATIALDPAQGMNVTDRASDVSFTMVPEFDLHSGKRVGDRILFPLKGMDGWLVYTWKYNGVKEDVVLLQPPDEDELTLSYRLDLPDNLEARLLEDGSIGIYGLSRILLGEVSTSSDEDAALLQAARQNAEKDTLIFTIPAPVLVGDGIDGAESRFELEGDSLEVVTTGLHQASYPLSIDPSVVIPSMESFGANSSDNGFITYNADGSISRSTLHGGETEEFSLSSNPLTTPKEGAATFVSNGFLYTVAGRIPDGLGTTWTRNVEYASINADGSIGSWQSTLQLPVARNSVGHVYYNGYIYIMAGSQDQDTVFIGEVSPEGGILSWSDGPNLPAARAGVYQAVAVYNGYIYLTGGCTFHSGLFGRGACGTGHAQVWFNKIRADGSLGSWQTTTQMPSQRTQHVTLAHNGYLYIIAGCWRTLANDNCEEYRDDAFRAKINADGTIGSWVEIAKLPIHRRAHFGSIVNGYIYIAGGLGQTGNRHEVFFAEIYESGDIAPWQRARKDLVTGVVGAGFEAHNGYLYVLGGGQSSPGLVNHVQIAKIKPPGEVTAGNTTAGTLDSSRIGHAVAIYAGHIYVTGGCTSDSISTCQSNNGVLLNTARLAPINPDGTIGTWRGAFTMPNNRAFHSMTVVKRYLVVAGGRGNCGFLGAMSACDTTINAEISNNTGNLSGNSFGNWHSRTSLPGGGYLRTGIASYGRCIYLVGGTTAGGGASRNNVLYTSIDYSDGSLSSWQQTTALPSARELPSAVAEGGYLYAGGGRDGSTYYSDVNYAQINANCSIGSWNATSSFNTSRDSPIFAAHKGKLYVGGGHNNGTYLTDIQAADINADGTLGAFSTSAQTIGTAGHATASHDQMVYDGRMYFAGGYTTGGVRSDNIEFVRIINDASGAQNSTFIQSPTYNDPRTSHASVITHGHLYLIGGSNSLGGANLHGVEYAPINADGTLGAWQFTTSVPNHSITINYLPSFAIGDYMYHIVASSTVNTAYYAQINTDGTLGSWQTTSGMPAARVGGAYTVVGDTVYVLGGTIGGSASTSIYYATQNPDGTLGTWQTNAIPLTSQREYAGAVAVRGYMYIFGGKVEPGGSVHTLGNVEYAPINPDGSLGAWSSARNLIAHNTPWAAVGFHNGYFYVGPSCSVYVGGSGCQRSLWNISRAPLIRDGVIGEWESDTVRLPSGSNSGTSLNIHNGHVYLSGGCHGGCTTTPNIYQNTYHAPLKTVLRKGEFSQDIDMNNLHSLSRYAATGSLAGGSATKTVLLSDTVTGAEVHPDPMTINAFTPFNWYSNILTDNLLSRYVRMRFILDDSKAAIFADEDTTTMNGYDIFYRPSPDTRLRGGKDFMRGNLRQLDTETGDTTN